MKGAVLAAVFLFTCVSCAERARSNSLLDRNITTKVAFPRGNLLTFAAYLERACVEDLGETNRQWIVDWTLPSVEIVCDEAAPEELGEVRQWSRSIAVNLLTATNVVTGLRDTGPFEVARISVSTLVDMVSQELGCELVDEGDRVVLRALPQKLEVMCYRLAGLDENTKDLLNLMYLVGSELDSPWRRYVWHKRGMGDRWYVMATPSWHAHMIAGMTGCQDEIRVSRLDRGVFRLAFASESTE